MLHRLALVFLACLLFAGCDYKALIEKNLPKEDDAIARRFLELVRTGDYVAADQMLDASLRGEKSETGFRELNSVLAHGEQLSVEVIGLHLFSNFPGDTKRTALTYQIRFADRWAVGTVTVQRVSGDATILGARFNWVPDSLESIHQFTFSGKTVGHYLVLAICIAVPVFIIFALVVCIRTPLRRRKWLWIIFILLGIGKFQLAWTSGLFGVQILSVSLLGAGMLRSSPYASWILSFGVPLGAIVFLAMRRKLRAPDKPGDLTAPPPVPPPLPPSAAP